MDTQPIRRRTLTDPGYADPVRGTCSACSAPAVRDRASGKWFEEAPDVPGQIIAGACVAKWAGTAEFVPAQRP